MNVLVTSKTNKQAMPCQFFVIAKYHQMNVTPLNIGTIPRTSAQYDSINEISEPSQEPKHPSNTN